MERGEGKGKEREELCRKDRNSKGKVYIISFTKMELGQLGGSGVLILA